ncbi:expressed unknown protein [Seminavis robusta]|uniref:Uncharacterized protein n=1 Tax=Seminavis robusta TaxID=568900 RepID=A0A9N8HQB7_9STRA|nr:expressed unknown protein [Seminavis robusta]|eukprot:Sro1270_g258010.1 n/a (252) ;mRNA; f:28349-29104
MDPQGSSDWVSSPTSPTANLLGYDFSKVCMEDKFNHRLTAKDASIWVDQALAPVHTEAFRMESAKNGHAWRGFWWNKSWRSTRSLSPVFTRFQLDHCTKHVFEMHGGIVPEDCIAPTSLDRFRDYEFHWLPSNTTVTSPTEDTEFDDREVDVSMLQQTEPTVICLVGRSHSAHFKATADRMGITAAATNVTFEYVDSGYPAEATPRAVTRQSMKNGFKCNKLIIAVGQWPASFMGGKPMLLNEYYIQSKRC